jgi:hypothetical protein
MKICINMNVASPQRPHLRSRYELTTKSYWKKIWIKNLIDLAATAAG